MGVPRPSIHALMRAIASAHNGETTGVLGRLSPAVREPCLRLSCTSLLFLEFRFVDGHLSGFEIGVVLEPHHRLLCRSHLAHGSLWKHNPKLTWQRTIRTALRMRTGPALAGCGRPVRRIQFPSPRCGRALLSSPCQVRTCHATKAPRLLPSTRPVGSFLCD